MNTWSDALKRHWTTCKTRKESGQNVPETPQLPKKSRRLVCDNCAQLKRACDLKSPCEACRLKQQICTYPNTHSIEPQPASKDDQLLAHSPDYYPKVALTDPGAYPDLNTNKHDSGHRVTPYVFGVPLWGLSNDSLSDNLDLLGSFDDSFPRADNTPNSLFDIPFSTPMWRLEYLYRSTTLNRHRGLLNCFECGDVYERAAASGKPIPLLHSLGPRASAGTALSFDELDVGPSEPGSWNSFVPLTPQDKGPFGLKTEEIANLFKSVTLSSSERNDYLGSWSAETESLCSRFFSPFNLCKFLELFWSLWYPNCPIIHKPTFSVEDTPCSLMVPMVLLGACLSEDTDDVGLARLWFDRAEHLVFNSLCFQESLICPLEESRYTKREKLHALQAAYLVCVYQNWEGSVAGKERIRRLRYSMIVAVCVTCYKEKIISW